MTDTTSQASPGRTEDYAALGGRIEQLKNRLDEASRQNQRRHRLLLVVGIAVIVFCVVGLSSLTSRVYQLDAHALTQLGRQHVERQLPDEMAALESFLKENAPKFISEILGLSLGLIPNLRAELIHALDVRMEAATEDFEAHLIDTMQETIVTTRANLDQLDPELSDVEKLEKLVAHVAGKFEEGSTAAFRDLYPHYAAEMHRIKSFLVELQHKEDEDLTEKQRLQKELIQTLLRLVAHAHTKSD